MPSVRHYRNSDRCTREASPCSIRSVDARAVAAWIRTIHAVTVRTTSLPTSIMANQYAASFVPTVPMTSNSASPPTRYFAISWIAGSSCQSSRLKSSSSTRTTNPKPSAPNQHPRANRPERRNAHSLHHSLTEKMPRRTAMRPGRPTPLTNDLVMRQ